MNRERTADLPPEVTIVVPYRNAAGMTSACLASVSANSGGIDYEVLLVDDASTEHPELPPGGRFRIIRSDTRLTYSAANNLAASAARGRWLVLLNNDTTVEPGWLEALLVAARGEERLGVLGNKHLYPDSGLLQHGGMAFDEAGFPFHLNPGIDPATPSACRRRELQCVTFACALIPAEVYSELGGLDPAYRNGFEDVDFCLRARAAGYRVVFTPGSTIRHKGQSTPGRTEHDEANWRLFRERWGGKVECDLARLTAEDARYDEVARNRAHARPSRAPGLHLAIDLAESNAFTWAAAELALALVRRGVRVSLPVTPFVPRTIEPEKRAALRELMRPQPYGTWHVKWTHYWPKYLKQALSGDVNAEFFCTNYRYREENRVLDLWMRHVQLNGHRKLAVSGFNVDALREVGVSGSDIATVPLGYAPEIDGLVEAPRTDGGSDLRILLVTNSHDLYRHGTDLAVQALGRAFGPEDPVVVHIRDYGTASGSRQLHDWIRAQPRFPRVVWHETFLPKAGLLQLYQQADLQFAPFRGEGFAMKVLDAMALGVPTLMPAFGGPLEFAAPGTFLPIPHREVPVGPSYDRDNFMLGEGAWWCEPDVDVMTDLLRSLPGRREELRRIGMAARAHVRPRFSWDASAARLMHALQGWQACREAAVAVRRSPDERPVSVVIPTKDRIEILDRTLAAYGAQTLPAADFELILVNDHGDPAALSSLVSRHANLPIRTLQNRGPAGPASSRNQAIDQARGEVVVITGDDIVPDRDFLRQHLEAHRRHAAVDHAFVGLTVWHPDVPPSPFLDHITGEGGQQFTYELLEHDEPAPFDRMYTSNCSLKRAFLAEEETLFSTRYSHAAYEDVELSYRLWLRGMQLRFVETAVGRHLHRITPRSFLERQRTVGRMLTLLALQRPSFVPNEHVTFLRSLEFLRSWPDAPVSIQADPQRLLEELIISCEAMLAMHQRLASPMSRPLLEADRAAWQKWMAEGSGLTWEAVNELVLRLGMAEEWSQRPADLARSRAWIQLVTLPRIAGGPDAIWKMPFAAPDFSAFLFPGSPLAYRASKFIRDLPGIGPGVVAFEQSGPGQWIRGALARMVRRG